MNDQNSDTFWPYNQTFDNFSAKKLEKNWHEQPKFKIWT